MPSSAITNMVRINLKLWAIKAIAEAERRGLDYLKANGEKIGDKTQIAEDYAMRQYANWTKTVAGLNASEMDDMVVRQMVKASIKWAWTKFGEQINELSHGPVVNDETLGEGVVE